jgi:hypothetical protein
MGTMAKTALMAFVQTMRRWQELSVEPGMGLSPVFAPPSVGVLLGGEIGGRTISEIYPAGPKPEAPEAGIDIHNTPDHWKDGNHEEAGTAMSHLEIDEATIASRQVLQSDLVDGPIQFTAGPNIGVQILGNEMSRLEGCRLLSLDMDKWGKIT